MKGILGIRTKKEERARTNIESRCVFVTGVNLWNDCDDVALCVALFAS